jgi:hypothetical protein
VVAKGVEVGVGVGVEVEVEVEVELGAAAGRWTLATPASSLTWRRQNG